MIHTESVATHTATTIVTTNYFQDTNKQKQTYIYTKQIKKMSSSHNPVEEAFVRAWNEKTIAGNDVKDNHSDSDSAEEERKALEKKKKKKNRSSRKHSRKERKQASTFNIRKKPPKRKITPQSNPEILCVDDHFKPTQTRDALIIAEGRFFQGKNAPSGRELTHLSPFDWPFIQNALRIPGKTTYDVTKSNNLKGLRAHLQQVGRGYEEKYLEEPNLQKGDRLCLKGNECEGLFIGDKADAFILKEFILPDDEKKGKKPQERQLCLLCKRTEIGRALLNSRAEGMGLRGDTILQDYYNIVGVPNQYCLENCLLSLPGVYEGLVEPVVQHIRTNYRILKKENGIKYVDQWKLGSPVTATDFRRGPE